MNPIVNKLKARSKVALEVDDEDLGKFTWYIRPLSQLELIEYSDKFEALPDSEELKSLADKDKDATVDVNDIKTIREDILPLLKFFIPQCSISPKVTLDENDPELDNPKGDLIHYSMIPAKVAMDLFNKILTSSGLGEKSEDARKKLPAPTSDSQ